MSKTVSKDGKPAADERADRLAAALKENLRRRKAQVRNRRDIQNNDAEGNDVEGRDRGAPDSEHPEDGGDNA